MRSVKDFHVTEKDLELISYLHKTKVATSFQIHRDIYSEITHDSANRRLRKLEDAGLILGIRNRRLLDGRKIVSLTKKGFESYLQTGDENRIELRSDSALHDLALVDIRSQLMKSPKVKKYFTENEIQTWGNVLGAGQYSPFVELNSDAVIEIEIGGQTFFIPIEFERSQKSLKRLAAMMEKYYLSEATPIVLMICAKASVQKQLQSLEGKEHSVENLRFFYCLEEDIFAGEAVVFSNCRKDELKIETNADLKKGVG